MRLMMTVATVVANRAGIGMHPEADKLLQIQIQQNTMLHSSGL